MNSWKNNSTKNVKDDKERLIKDNKRDEEKKNNMKSNQYRAGGFSGSKTKEVPYQKMKDSKTA